jgi:hypothetical protein
MTSDKGCLVPNPENILGLFAISHGITNITTEENAETKWLTDSI